MSTGTILKALNNSREFVKLLALRPGEDVPVATSDDRVGVVVVASAICARAHGNNPSWLRHLIVSVVGVVFWMLMFLRLTLVVAGSLLMCVIGKWVC